MADETTRIDKPSRSVKDHASIASILLALLVGGGGFVKGNDVSTRLEQVAVTLAEIKGSIKSQDEGRARLEIRIDRLEERMRQMEMGKK